MLGWPRADAEDSPDSEDRLLYKHLPQGGEHLTNAQPRYTKQEKKYLPTNLGAISAGLVGLVFHIYRGKKILT